MDGRNGYAPVAVTAVMLIALGFHPLKAAAVGLLANTAPVAYGGMFGALHVTAAKESGLSPVLLSAANTSGGVLAKMISPQSLAVAAAAVAVVGAEGALFRRVFFWSLALLALLCVIVYLQSTALLSWMVPG